MSNYMPKTPSIMFHKYLINNKIQNFKTYYKILVSGIVNFNLKWIILDYEIILAISVKDYVYQSLFKNSFSHNPQNNKGKYIT